MKKCTVLTFVFLFILSFKNNAQDLNEYGISFGGNASWISVESITYDKRIGFIVGVFGEWNTTNLGTIKTRLEFANRGFVNNTTLDAYLENSGLQYTNEEITLTTRLSYISLFAGPKFSLLSLDLNNFYISIGPRFNYLIDYKEGEYNTQINNTEVTLGDGTASSMDDFSIDGSIETGLKLFNLKEHEVNFGVRFNHELTNSSPSAFMLRNKSIELLLGLNL